MSNRIIINRKTYSENQVLGIGIVVDANDIELFNFVTIELPWLENKRRISCIPAGVYSAIKHNSPKFGQTLWLQEVPNRSEILIHSANFSRQLLGCIAPGEIFIDIDKDGLKDVNNSRATMEKILKFVGNRVQIVILS